MNPALISLPPLTGGVSFFMEINRLYIQRKSLDKLKLFKNNYPEFIVFERHIDKIEVSNTDLILVDIRNGSEGIKPRLTDFFKKHYPTLKIYYNE